MLDFLPGGIKFRNDPAFRMGRRKEAVESQTGAVRIERRNPSVVNAAGVIGEKL